MKSSLPLNFVPTMLVAITAGLTIPVAARESAPAPAPRFSHPREITNMCLPLGLLKHDLLVSRDGRVERTARPELEKVFEWQGQTIHALVVEDREFAGGELEEVALDYFAQADDGAVYYLGEDVDEYKHGKISGHSGAWLLGRDTQTPGVLLPAHPKVGDKFKSENVPNITVEDDEVVSVSEKVSVPAGTYENCVKVKESPSDGKIEYKYYAPGVGCVKEVEADAEFRLKTHDTVKSK